MKAIDITPAMTPEEIVMAGQDYTAEPSWAEKMTLPENETQFIDLSSAMTPEEIETAHTAPDDISEKERAYRRKFAQSGGLAKSPKKTLACRENGKKGGWPKGKLRGKRTAGGEAHTGAMWPIKDLSV